MGGLYGTIDSREAFFRMLDEARVVARRMLDVQPGNPAVSAIARQLDAMDAFRGAAGAPTPEERARITVGLIAARELDAERPDESGELARRLHALNNYFDDWPTDAEAASATDADFWARFGL